MILKIAYQDPNNDLGAYWDAMRGKNYKPSFDGVKRFIKENEHAAHKRKPRKTRRTLQWILAAFIPVIVLLACTRTESTEPMGYTISFSMPEKNSAATAQLQAILQRTGSQTITAPDKRSVGFIAYTSFIPAAKAKDIEGLISNLKALPGINKLAVAPVNTTIKESLLSRLSYKIFRTHIDAKGLNDAELQQTIHAQLKKSGIDNVGVSVSRDQQGYRLVNLIPTDAHGDYSIHLKIDDGLLKTEIKEERQTLDKEEEFRIDTMTDKEIKSFIQTKYPEEKLTDEEIKITRNTDYIIITMKPGTYSENQFRFTIKQ